MSSSLSRQLLIVAATAIFLAVPACKPPQNSSDATPPPAAAEPSVAKNDSLPATVTFNEDIQPILSEYCYHCHGPDSGTRKPKDEPLRLDRPDAAFAKRTDGKPVILKGDPAASPLMLRLKSKDPERVMPPPSAHKDMPPRAVALLERWIAQGATYQDHWSFIPPARPAVPDAGKSWSEQPIDRFISAKLAAAGLSPNPPETPRRLARRIFLDLTGLPPEPADLDDFEKACAKDQQAAVAQLADRLLDSPAHAEQQARLWLDAARYADTHGIHIDNYRSIWPYRDWVIGAFRHNMRWDEFTTGQIAGDLLPNATLEQKIATGFNRCLATTGEGGAIAEEYDAVYAKDRVDTTSAVWLGLTTGCASCHDHKFDPLTMRDFYSLAAFFRNTPMTALDGNNADHPPNVFAPVPEDRPRWNALDQEIAAARKAVEERGKSARPDFEKWLAAAVVSPPADDPTLNIHIPLAGDADNSLHGTLGGQPHDWPSTATHLDGPLGPAQLASSAVTVLGDIGSFARTGAATYGGFIYLDGKTAGSVVARMDPADNFRGWDIWLEDGRIGSHVIDQWPAAAHKVMTNAPLAPKKWHHVMVVFDGSKPAAEMLTVYLDGARADTSLVSGTIGANIITKVPLRIGSRDGDVGKLQGTVGLQDFRFYRRALAAKEIAELAGASRLKAYLALAADRRTPQLTDELYQHYLAAADPVGIELRAKADALAKEQAAIRTRGSVTLVMAEKPNSQPKAHILARGQYSAPGEEVGAAVPAVLPQLPPDAPHNRLGLARWLTDRRNPLPARVTMNRLWAQLFGTGIVETISDFGVVGARPSHPQLLDWLAVEFMDSGWDHNHMLKTILLSKTYQQSSVTTAAKQEKDPLNRLLARGPRPRLDAEQIRDLALATSGLLSHRVGGPPVKPYQPDGIWDTVAMEQSNTRIYKQDEGEALYRRSLYTFWKRTAPPPSMEIFNAPTREVSCVRRDQTNTPLQALVLLNDPQFVETSRQLATAACKSGADFNPRLDYISLRLLGRTFGTSERPVVKRTYDRMLAAYKAKPADASELIATGASKPDPSIAPPELAAWTMVASQILNLDETVTK